MSLVGSARDYNPGVSFNSDRSYYKPKMNTQRGKISHGRQKRDVSKSLLKATEKCPRSIKRRPKSSKLFLINKAKKSTPIYRSDFYPENKVRYFIRLSIPNRPIENGGRHALHPGVKPGRA